MKTIYIKTNKELTKRKITKIAKKLYKMNKKEEVAVALSKNIGENQELKEKIKDIGIKILDGKWLFKFLLCDIIEYVTKSKNEKQAMQTVAILIEKQDEIILAQLPEIAKRIKTLKIINKGSPTYTYLEEKLYAEYGIAIEITNNKTKSLANVDIIINYDFTQEKIREYKINPQAILINIEEKIEKNTKTNINNYKIEYNKENFTQIENEKEFDQNTIYESYIYRKDTYRNIRKQLINDNVKLIELS